MVYPNRRYQIYLRSSNGPIDVYLISRHDELSDPMQLDGMPFADGMDPSVHPGAGPSKGRLGAGHDSSAAPPASSTANNSVGLSAAPMSAVKPDVHGAPGSQRHANGDVDMPDAQAATNVAATPTHPSMRTESFPLLSPMLASPRTNFLPTGSPSLLGGFRPSATSGFQGNSVTPTHPSSQPSGAHAQGHGHPNEYAVNIVKLEPPMQDPDFFFNMGDNEGIADMYASENY